MRVRCEWGPPYTSKNCAREDQSLYGNCATTTAQIIYCTILSIFQPTMLNVVSEYLNIKSLYRIDEKLVTLTTKYQNRNGCITKIFQVNELEQVHTCEKLIYIFPVFRFIRVHIEK